MAGQLCECDLHQTLKGDQRQTLLGKVVARGGGWSPDREGRRGAAQAERMGYKP